MILIAYCDSPYAYRDVELFLHKIVFEILFQLFICRPIFNRFKLTDVMIVFNQTYLNFE